MYKQICLARFAANFLVRTNGVRSFGTTPTSFSGGHGHEEDIEHQMTMTHHLEKANGRAIVGHFLNGDPMYSDRIDYPYPSIRFKKDEGEILKLREKEKGDWKKLSLEEKKGLYRASFCATFSETLAPNGHWKCVLALIMGLATCSLWYSLFFKTFCTAPIPPYYSEEAKEVLLQHMIDTYSEPVTGVGAKWDYEKNRWKA